MKVRLLKDWSFHKEGEIAEVFEPTARNWILNGIASELIDSRSVLVEQAVDGVVAEKATQRPTVKK